ncbi:MULTISPECIES: aldo/keto reductase [Pacificibacter]|uniref:aldo/keto reductase n=1 Tax=Pacificibacter TaxID=1042323 RepID=UPI001C08EFCD|nr:MULTISPECIES: aldo/keto reductase [Pacificibacter]MBU2936429.1 aldo/keto reductase [Pacificibacter marinus]MDO6616530.1 aldo/keto reductase [Pacificibacter sp. 1_MG-2023]
MERIRFSDTLEMSRIVYGMWRVADDADTSVKHVTAKIEACLAQGITTFDQADIYGDYTAEAVLGTALRGQSALRDQMQIVTKCDIVAPCGKYSDVPVKYYDTSAAHLNASVEASLTSMAIDHIDLLLVHRPDPLMDHHETGAALDALVASGKVGNIGVSNFKPWDWDLLQAGMNAPLVTNQLEVSLSAHEGLVNGDIAFHQKNAQPIMAWSPLGGGALMTADDDIGRMLDVIANENGVDRSAVAVAWVLAHPAKILPVMGTNNLTRIAAISDAFKVKMDRQTWYKLYTAALGREVA